jgi:glycopeptide antibiotics resistance protein
LIELESFVKKTENNQNKNNKITRAVLWGLFVVYCGILVWMLYLSRDYRGGYTFGEYISRFSNFIPFKTVFHYAKIASTGSLEFIGLFLWNIMGNLVMLLPLGAVLPCLFRRIDRFWKVVITVTVTIILIELAQLILRVGVIDIDDLILNLSGAMIGYAILKIPPLSRGLRAIGALPERDEKAAEKTEEKEEKERQYTLK